ncbi:MAG: response regulator [Lentimicrobiaceae bacterium]|jgi:two-component system LytT family response regulator
MQPVSTIIIDDEPLARDLVKRYASDIEGLTVVAECGDGFEALRQIQEFKPDLLFLDIQMPKLDGFELLEVLDYTPAIIFATAFDQFAIKAFEMNAVDYLLKPFSKERFDAAVQKAIQRIGLEKLNANTTLDKLKENVQESRGTLDRIVTRLGSKVTVIPVDRIWYIESADDYVMIYSELGNHLKEKTMKYFEEHLPANNFVRIHRGSIINLAQIAAIDPYTKDTHMVTLKCGAKLRASAEGYKKLRALL